MERHHHEHDPSLNPNNEDHLIGYEGCDNPIVISQMRQEYRQLLDEKIDDIMNDPSVATTDAAEIERMAAEEVEDDIYSDIISYIRRDPEFSAMDDVEFESNQDELHGIVMDWLTMSDRDWAGDVDADGNDVGNGTYDRLSYEIYEELHTPAEDDEDADDDAREPGMIDALAEAEPRIDEVLNDIDEVRDALAHLTARPWSLKARRAAARALGSSTLLPAHLLRNKLHGEWKELKREYATLVRDTSSVMSAAELGLDPSLNDDEINASVSRSIIEQDIDDFTEFERTKLASLKSKRFGRFNEFMHKGTKFKRAMKYLALGVPTAVLGILAAPASGVVGSGLLAAAVAGRFGSRYAMWSGRDLNNESVDAMSSAAVTAYRQAMTGLDAHLADDSFHPDYDQATARAETIVDDVRKKERNKRLKSVGFAAGMIVVPTLLSRVADHFGIIDWIKDRHWNPGEWKFSDGTPTKPVVDRSFVVYTPHGAENVLPLIGTNSVNTDAFASMSRLFNASGATPWARAHEFMGSATGARDWLNQAVARTPGASWHNLGDGIATNDWISINGNSDTAFVWDKLTQAMLTP